MGSRNFVLISTQRSKMSAPELHHLSPELKLGETFLGFEATWLNFSPADVASLPSLEQDWSKGRKTLHCLVVEMETGVLATTPLGNMGEILLPSPEIEAYSFQVNTAQACNQVKIQMSDLVYKVRMTAAVACDAAVACEANTALTAVYEGSAPQGF